MGVNKLNKGDFTMDIKKVLELGNRATTTISSPSSDDPMFHTIKMCSEYFVTNHSYTDHTCTFFGAEVTQEYLDYVVISVENWVERGLAEYVDYDWATKKISHVVIKDGDVYDIQWTQETKKPNRIIIHPVGDIFLTVERHIYRGHDTWNDSKYYV